MPVVIPDGFAQANIRLRHTSQQRSAEMTFGLAPDPTQTNPVNIANNILAVFVSRISPILDNEVRIEGVTVRLGQPSGDPAVGSSTTEASNGAGNASTPPPNVAVLVRKLTGLGGRRNRGRMYFPWGVNEASVSEAGIISAGDLAVINTAWEGFRADVAAHADLGPVVILHDSSRYTVTHPTSSQKLVTRTTVVPPAPTTVTAFSVDSRVATQRRRLR